MERYASSTLWLHLSWYNPSGAAEHLPLLGCPMAEYGPHRPLRLLLLSQLRRGRRLIRSSKFRRRSRLGSESGSSVCPSSPLSSQWGTSVAWVGQNPWRLRRRSFGKHLQRSFSSVPSRIRNGALGRRRRGRLRRRRQRLCYLRRRRRGLCRRRQRRRSFGKHLQRSFSSVP